MRKKVLLLIVILLIISCLVALYISYSNKEKQTSDIFDEINFSVPDGWFVNKVEPDILLTRHKRLSNIDDTEIYAYGDSISIEEILVDTNPENWIQQHLPEDDPLYLKKEWIDIEGVEIYAVLMQAGGASGYILTYHYFDDNKVLIFSLYSEDHSGKEQDLKNVLISYLESRDLK